MEETEQPTSNATLDALESAARQLDEQGGEGQVEVELSSAQQSEDRTPDAVADDKQEVQTPEKPESSATNAEEKPKVDRARDPKTGKFLPATAKAAEQVTPERPESEYSRAKKEEERQKSVLAGFQKEKEEFRRQVEAFNAQVAQQQQQRPQRATKEGFTAEDYLKAAKDFEKDGDHAMALEARKAANEILSFERNYYQQQQANYIDQTFKHNMNVTIHEHPELGDPNNEWSKQVMDILGTYDWLYYVEGGFKLAADVGKLRLDAALVPELRKQLEQTEANLSSTSSKLQPVRGRVSTPSGPKSFKDMSPEEQHRYLEQRAEELDAQGMSVG